MDKLNFYVTFLESSPFRYGYVLVQASSKMRAKEITERTVGIRYERLWPEHEFMAERYPLGQLGRVIVEE